MNTSISWIDENNASFDEIEAGYVLGSFAYKNNSS